MCRLGILNTFSSVQLTKTWIQCVPKTLIRNMHFANNE